MPCTPRHCRRDGPKRPRRRRNLQRKKYLHGGWPGALRRPGDLDCRPSRFAAEPTPVVDPRRIEALRELGGQEGFLGDVIETFRADAQQIMRRLTRAAAIADVAAFAQGLRARPGRRPYRRHTAVSADDFLARARRR